MGIMEPGRNLSSVQGQQCLGLKPRQTGKYAYAYRLRWTGNIVGGRAPLWRHTHTQILLRLGTSLQLATPCFLYADLRPIPFAALAPALKT